MARGCGPGPSAALGGFSLGNCVFLKGGCTEITASKGPPAILALFSQGVFVANTRKTLWDDYLTFELNQSEYQDLYKKS